MSPTDNPVAPLQRKTRNPWPCKSCRTAARRCHWTSGNETCGRCASAGRACSGPTFSDGSNRKESKAARGRAVVRVESDKWRISISAGPLESVALSSSLKYHLLQTCYTGLGGDAGSFSPEMHSLFPASSRALSPADAIRGSTAEEELQLLSQMMHGLYLTDHSAVVKVGEGRSQLGRTRRAAVSAFSKLLIQNIASVFRSQVAGAPSNGESLLSIFQGVMAMDAQTLLADGVELLYELVKFSLEVVPTIEDEDVRGLVRQYSMYFLKLLGYLGFRCEDYGIPYPDSGIRELTPFPAPPSQPIIEEIIFTPDAFEHPEALKILFGVAQLSNEVPDLIVHRLFSPSAKTFEHARLFLESTLPPLQDWIEILTFHPNLTQMASVNRRRGPHKLIHSLLFGYIQLFITAVRCCQVSFGSYKDYFGEMLQRTLMPLGRFLKPLVSSDVLMTPFERHALVSQGFVPSLWGCYMSNRELFFAWARESPTEAKELREVLSYAAEEAYEACELLSALENIEKASEIVLATLSELDVTLDIEVQDTATPMDVKKEELTQVVEDIDVLQRTLML